MNRYCYHYPSRAHMAAAHPHEAYLLSNIATLSNGLFTAQLDTRVFTWNETSPSVGANEK